MNKILFINNYLSGLLHFRMDVMKHLQGHGYEIVAVVPLADKGPEKVEGIRVEYVEFNRTSTNPYHDLRFMWQLLKLFRRERPQYAFLFTIKPNIYGTFAAKLCGVPSSMMMAGLGYTFTNNHLPSRIARALYRIALHFSDKLMLLNEDNVKTILNKKMCAQDKIVHLKGGEGVNLSRYEFCSNESEKVKFLFVGRLLKEKGIFDFVEAASLVKSDFPDAEFQIAGGLDKDFPDSMSQQELDELISSGVVNYLGSIDMVEKLQESGIVITIPSYYSEGLNRSLMEGCAAGKPIITSVQPGCRETVIDGQNGYLVPIKQPRRLAEALIKYIDLNPDEKKRMSLESRKLAEERFNVQHVLRVYDDILEAARQRSGGAVVDNV